MTEKAVKRYEELEFTDDFMFGKVLYNNPELCREVLELILGRKIRRIRYPETQKTVAVTGDAKGVRLDVYTEDDENAVYDVEMQTTVKKDIPRRSRYYHSMLDLNLIEKGMPYEELKECYVIFICKESIGDLPVYSYQMRCDENPALELGDGTRTVFLNAGGKVETGTVFLDDHGEPQDVSKELAEFLKYIRTGQASGDSDSLTNRLQASVLHAREHKEWRVEYMTLYLHDMDVKEEGRAEGIAIGERKGALEMLFGLVRDNVLSIEAAAERANMGPSVFEKKYRAYMKQCRENERI